MRKPFEDSEKRTNADYVRILREKYNWHVEDSEHKEVPEPNQRYLLKDNHYWVKVLRGFVLENYIFNDKLRDNKDARKEVKEKMRKEDPFLDSWIKKHDKLRKGLIDHLYIAIQTIPSNLKEEHPKVHNRLKGIVTFDLFMFYASYAVMPFESKSGLVKRLDDVAYKFLDVLSK
jgi:hypothetical protein